jgi:hypothetical protein
VLARQLDQDWRKGADLLEAMVSVFSHTALNRYAVTTVVLDDAMQLSEDERTAIAILARRAPPLQSVGAALPLPKDLDYFLVAERPLNRFVDLGESRAPIFRQFQRYANAGMTRAELLAGLRNNLDEQASWLVARDVADGVYAEPFRATLLPPRDLGFLVELVDPVRTSVHGQLVAYGRRLADEGSQKGMQAEPSFARCAVATIPLARNLRDRGEDIPPWLGRLLTTTSEISAAFKQMVEDVLAQQ